MYEIGVRDAFEAAHHLNGDFGPATRQHGHTYSVEVVLRGPALRGDGTLYDIGRLRAALRREMEELHYQDLNELPAFAERNSTAEQVATYLLERLKGTLEDPQVDTIAIRVFESAGAFAGIEAQLG